VLCGKACRNWGFIRSLQRQLRLFLLLLSLFVEILSGHRCWLVLHLLYLSLFLFVYLPKMLPRCTLRGRVLLQSLDLSCLAFLFSASLVSKVSLAGGHVRWVLVQGLNLRALLILDFTIFHGEMLDGERHVVNILLFGICLLL